MTYGTRTYLSDTIAYVDMTPVQRVQHYDEHANMTARLYMGEVSTFGADTPVAKALMADYEALARGLARARVAASGMPGAW